MAIKNTYTDNWTDTHPDAHIKINRSEEDWAALSLELTYFVYKNATHAKNSLPPIDQSTIVIRKADAPPALRQAAKAYRNALTDYLKTVAFDTGEIVADSDPTA